jgi:hypothetical protein
MTDGLKYLSAQEIAAILSITSLRHSTTGMLSMLDEATLAFGRQDERVQKAQEEFSAARHRLMRSYDRATKDLSPVAWQDAIDKAHALAEVLATLGDTRIIRCQRPSERGVCALPIDPGTECDSSMHITEGKQ